jgi:hypothetical protein
MKRKKGLVVKSGEPEYRLAEVARACPLMMGGPCRRDKCHLWTCAPGLADEREAIAAEIPVTGAGRCALLSLTESLSCLTDTVKEIANVLSHK